MQSVGWDRGKQKIRFWICFKLLEVTFFGLSSYDKRKFVKIAVTFNKFDKIILIGIWYWIFSPEAQSLNFSDSKSWEYKYEVLDALKLVEPHPYGMKGSALITLIMQYLKSIKPFELIAALADKHLPKLQSS